MADSPPTLHSLIASIAFKSAIALWKSAIVQGCQLNQRQPRCLQSKQHCLDAACAQL